MRHAWLVTQNIVLLFFLCLVNYFIFTKYQPQKEFWTTDGQCRVPAWNRVETTRASSTYWDVFSKWLWMKLNLSYENNQNYTSISLLGAYVYPEYISISITAQYMVKQNVYCRYYDCEKREIPISAWNAIVFPESVIHCPRRVGAEFVSVSMRLEDEAPTPMRLMFRAYQEPVHEFAVCVAPLYGKEPKWLQIAEFIEHHKLEGATYFYFHIGDISNYDRRMLDHYEKLGDIEVKVFDDKYERPFYAWQLLEIQDCHLRSKFHSKWTAFIDIDERISTLGGRFVDLLSSVDNGQIGEIQLQILNIARRGEPLEKHEKFVDIRKELFFEKYVSSIEPTWNASKVVIRSDKVGIVHVHYAVAKELQFDTVKLNSTQAVVRHYRSTQHRIGENGWDTSIQADGKPLSFTDRPLAPYFREMLTNNVIKHVKDVYEKVATNCSTIPKVMWTSRKFPDPCLKMLLTW